ncbi:MAG: phosphoribosylglycinamide formyltransferase [Terrisporobacter othiniensis]|uniref:Phosphoribosylglycinamide formyltransferase n=1 Tax=Terrisporobacter hibernicus TaxID=2813371 RepID=A0AAX2ZAX7_9FIRM|nr:MULTISPECIES: phosphoribosylglycinamide formyltransferase [Terrisporobacter]MDU4861985.1 phosphoribosylglycinamide formyltransferase [Terrisporobacter othiniensis]MDU6995621.1 phosphoribosylglycinamide formyltransferase [Terrisporobacter othiniensis]UEL46066.1 phosphoribosylglycinamide formyltransferase [Terrisporobacter hibernicus]UPA30327.1 phosphoribosylglycinamide formyltransferase [Terrisporobacter glycolicus]
MVKIGVLISGGGTNLQAVIDNCENKTINGKVEVVISNKSEAFGLQRAKNHNIKAVFENKEDKIIEILKENKVELVVLAGYLKIISPKLVNEYKNRIINIHPSLIPAFCGKGYYGEKVHQGVIDYGAKVTGATVHFVDEGADTGPIIMQKTVEVKQDDDVKKLAARVLDVEHEILAKSIAMFCENKLTVQGRRVYIND